MEEPKKFEDLPAIKSSTLEEYILEDGNEGFLEKMIHSLQEKLAKNKDKAREAEYLASPAGKQYLANEAERIKQKAIYEKRNADAYNEILHSARQQLALEMKSEDLIREYKLDKLDGNDKRLSKIINELQKMREIISGLQLKH